MAEKNVLYYGDNLEVLRQHVKDETVDLVYLDPPFNSSQDYNVLFSEHGTRAAAQIKAFEDTWQWDASAARAFEDVVVKGGKVSRAMQSFRTFLGESDMLAYLSMMGPRLVELQRVLKPTGSIYLHCDPTASHYLKMLMDAVFEPQNFLNEIIWKRSSAHSSSKRYSPVHDTILFYAKGQGHTWKPEYAPLPQVERARRRSVVALLAVRIGTAIASAQRLGRRWIGIDITHLAVNLIKTRLRDAFGAEIEKSYRVIGEPTTLDDAKELAEKDPYQFQWWALGLVGARPAQEKKGADKGIDGRLYFHDEGSGATKHVILSVKAGGVTASQVRDLRGVVERERAQIGVLISFEEPTKPMRSEAASAGIYSSPLGTKHSVVQLVTVGELLAGKNLDLPSRLFSTFKAAPKAAAPEEENLPLLAAERVEPYGEKKPKRKGGK